MNALKFLHAAIILTASTAAFAQVTTSGMSGRISDGEESLPGAAVTVTHEPSGTVYRAISNDEGRYSIQGMRTGGPYTAGVHYLGYGDFIQKEIYLQLGETHVLDVRMDESEQMLNEVVVSAKGAKFTGNKTGSMTNINSRTMLLIPSVSRSLSDYTKLSPYASGTGSFGGRPAYTTNITIDGANFNNNFGLEDNPMPGPSATSSDPVSMEAVEEMQMAVAPFDVRQSNFTGAGVNVVTKSGTNELHGTIYSFFRNRNMNGTKIGSQTLTSEAERQVYGLSAGGPIIRNKLFLFVNAEMENNLTPGNTLLARDAGRDKNNPNVSQNVQADDLKAFSQFLHEFGYETGRYENWGGDNESARKLLIKTDWNIHQNHKASFRYNFSKSESTNRAHSADDALPQITRERHAREGGISFENSQYTTPGVLHSFTAELNSNFTGALSNKLLAACTFYDQSRRSNSSVFPFIDIMDNSETDVLMSAGYEMYSYNNAVKNNTLILTDNITCHWGRHTVTGGLSYENQYVLNNYWRQGTGYYRFKNLEAFERYVDGEGAGESYNSDYHPLNFAYTYPINGYTYAGVEFLLGQFSAYAQDEWQLTDAFKLTGGLRIDVPAYLSESTGNPALNNVEFRNGETVDLSTWPKTRALLSPRIGFNCDLTDDIKLRGGAGIFTGRVPLVWFVNQMQYSGMLKYQLILNSNADSEALAKIPFAENVYDLLGRPELDGIFPKANAAGGSLTFIDRNFKLPQMLRVSLGADIRLPANILLTLVGIYSKDIHAVRFENINLKDPDAFLLEGDSKRPCWTGDRYLTQPYKEVIALRNTDRGWGALGSARLTFPEYNGFSGTVAYSFSRTEEVTGKNGSDPFSEWKTRPVAGSPNSEETGFSMNNTPHRIIASAAYRMDYANRFRSTVSLFYTGCSGRAFSYLYYGDANGDGTACDLMYIPNSKEDFIWENDGDAEKYFAYADADPYLSKHAGEYARRYAAHEPFYHRLDLRFLQDFFLNVSGRQNTVQLSLDILNLPNLLHSSWGINRITVAQNITPLKFERRDEATGKPVVSLNNIDGPYQDPTSVSSTWNLQIGVRYIF